MRCPGGMLCSVVLILEACEDSLLDRPKYVPGRGAPRIMWAVHGVVSHVHSGARAIELKECHSVQEAPDWLRGIAASSLGARGGEGEARAQAEDGEAGAGHI